MYVAQYPTPGSLFAEEVILDEFCFASEFHPHRNILVTGMVSGKLCAFEFSEEKYTPLTPLLLHTTAIRSLRFNAAGTTLCTGSTDKTTRLLDVETQQTIWKSLRKVHHGPVNSVHILADTHQIATGDDTGLVNVFDMRSGSLISSFDEHGDFITGLTYVASRSRLVSSSGDGTIGVYDVRKGKLIGLPTIPSKSDEMMCIDKFHYGTRVICGTSKGHLISWDVGSADVFDHYHKLRGNVREISTLLIVPAHANDSYCANQQLDIALFGARDGIIRSLVVKPNEERFLTILGEVNAGGVESLSFCPRTGVVAAISSDAIRFLDGTLFQNGDALDECVRSKMTEDEVVVGGTERGTAQSSGNSSEFTDTDDSSEQSLDSDEERTRKVPRKKGAVNIQRDTQKERFRNFFSGLQ